MARDSKKRGSRSSLPASFRVGAIALVFLIIGYQVALFVRQAAVSEIAAVSAMPDTVYVVDKALARQVLSEGGLVGGASGGGTRPEEGRNWGSGSKSCGVGERAPGRSRPQGGDGASAPGGGPAVREQGRAGGAAAPEDFQTHVDTSGSVVTVSRTERTDVQKQILASVRRTYESFPFDPNTVSLEDLQRLGFSEKQAASIDNYRQKGGRFRRKEDFQRSFVVADSVYRRLEGFIRIPKLDINAADSAAFDALPGIGPYFASKMVSYRGELGGAYSYAEQLMDIYKFDEERFRALEDLIEVGPGPAYPLWSLPADSLRRHPYIRSAAVARGIVLFRENSPRSEWSVPALSSAGILPEADASRLTLCRLVPPE